MINPNDIFLTLIGFILGMLATVLAQAISRRLRLADARKTQKIEYIQQIRNWILAYRYLFDCDYPQILELVLAHKFLSPRYNVYDRDETIPLRIYQALKEFQNARVNYVNAENIGISAIDYLNKRRCIRAQKLAYFINIYILKRDLKMHYQISKSHRLIYPRGLLINIVPYLEVLYTQRISLFEEFPETFIHSIDWNLLDYIEPSNVRAIVKTLLSSPPYPYPAEDPFDVDENYWKQYWAANEKYTEEEIELVDEMREATKYRVKARNAIESVLKELKKFEDKWIPPVPG